MKENSVGTHVRAGIKADVKSLPTYSYSSGSEPEKHFAVSARKDLVFGKRKREKEKKKKFSLQRGDIRFLNTSNYLMVS